MMYAEDIMIFIISFMLYKLNIHSHQFIQFIENQLKFINEKDNIVDLLNDRIEEL